MNSTLGSVFRNEKVFADISCSNWEYLHLHNIYLKVNRWGYLFRMRNLIYLSGVGLKNQYPKEWPMNWPFLYNHLPRREESDGCTSESKDWLTSAWGVCPSIRTIPNNSVINSRCQCGQARTNQFLSCARSKKACGDKTRSDMATQRRAVIGLPMLREPISFRSELVVSASISTEGKVLGRSTSIDAGYIGHNIRLQVSN